MSKLFTVLWFIAIALLFVLATVALYPAAHAAPSAMRVTTMPQPTAVQPTQEAHPAPPPPDDAYPAPPDAYPAPAGHHHEHTPDAPKPGLHCGHC